jgi:hypothetical protein
MAYFSKKILPEPIGYIPLAIPPFIATLYEYVLTKYKDSKISTTWYWIVLIFFSTFLVIYLSSFQQSNKSPKVDSFLLPDGFRIPHDVSEYYIEHQSLLDSIFALNPVLSAEALVIQKLKKSSPKEFEPLILEGDTLLLKYDGGRMEGMEREEDYKVLLNGENIFEFSSRVPVPTDHIHGFFIWNNDWILEYYKAIIINGVNLNQIYQYEASFFVSVVGNDLFYLAEKDDRIYIVQNNDLTDYWYDEVIVYQCCDYERYNPRFSKNMLSFIAKKDSHMYFVNMVYKDNSL